MRIIPRTEWGARSPRSHKAMVDALDKVFIHWLGNAYPASLSDAEVLRRVQAFHMDSRRWSDIAYSFAIGREVDSDGLAKVYDLRGLNVAGGHTRTENHDSYGVVFLIGEGEHPTPAMLEAFPLLVEHIRNHHGPFPIPPEDITVLGHRHDAEASTACPGAELAAFAWDYNHARDYVGQDAPQEDAAMEATATALYRVFLHREPDPAGLAFWTGQLEADPVAALLAFLASPEAQSKGLALGIAPEVVEIPEPEPIDVEAVAEEVATILAARLTGE